MKKQLLMSLVIVLLLVTLTPQVSAQPSSESNAAAINTIWVLVAAFLVFFMQAGFAMVEAGFTRAKNAGNIIMKNIIDFSAGTLVYWSVGFAFMFGLGNGFIGSEGFFVQGDFAHLGLDIPIIAFWLFQAVFAAAAATIVSGAMAERTKYSSYLIYSIFITGFIYPLVGHWTWGGGWLDQLGFVDFAGSTVVHSVGGWAALAGTIVLRPRLGKYSSSGRPNALPGHNILMAALGVFILWLGWFGFNPGSTLSGVDLSIALIAVTTNLSAAAGCIFAMVTSWLRYGKADVSMTLNGALAGLVGITAGAADVNTLGAVLIGAAAGIVVVFGVEFLDRIHVDDPVGAISVHGICGALGTVLVGFFALDGGLLYGGGFSLIGVQLVGIASVALWTFATAWVLFKTIDIVFGLRVSAEEELEGLDLAEHGASSYPEFFPLQGKSFHVTRN